MKAQFIGSCPDLPASFVNELIDNEREITYRTLIKHVPYQEIQQQFPAYGKFMHIKNDYHVSFGKSKVKGKQYYFVRWSSMEFVWRTS